MNTWSYVKILTGITAGLFCYVQMVQGIAAAAEPKEPSKEIKYLLGFYYGNGENILIRERDGGLDLIYRTSQDDKDFSKANIFPLSKERFDAYQVNEAGPMSSGDGPVHFVRDKEGYCIALKVGGHSYNRRFIGQNEGDRGKPVKLPAHTDEEWQAFRKEAESAVIPPILCKGQEAKLVNARTVEGLRINSIYGQDDNLFGAPLYSSKELLVSEGVAEALRRVQQDLAGYGYGLVLWDAYRPWHISKLANLALPKNGKDMLEDPMKKGSPHNTGNSIDVGLYDLANGAELEMISGYDEPSFRQYSAYPGGTTRERYRRDLLRQIMEKHGFKGINMEWWHFDYAAETKWVHLNSKF